VNQNQKTALTLTEVVVVVVIVLLLCLFAVLARAVFLQLTVRRKAVRTPTFLRQVCVAAEAYRIDYGVYPLPVEYFLAPAFLTSKEAVGKGLTSASIVKQFGLGKPDAYGRYAIMRPGLWPLAVTTPLAYVSSWGSVGPEVRVEELGYMVYGPPSSGTLQSYIMAMTGPDGDLDLPIYAPVATAGSRATALDPSAGPPDYGLARPLADYRYDPTNGFRSSGDIFQKGGTAFEAGQ
jgi:hypothetical protein